jgi:hypothetical protein
MGYCSSLIHIFEPSKALACLFQQGSELEAVVHYLLVDPFVNAQPRLS